MELFRPHVPGGRVAGVYAMNSTVQSVAASAQNGTSTGFGWFYLLADATKSVRIRRLTLKFNTSAATPTMPTIPRIGLTRFTYEGTAAGASFTVHKIAPATQPDAAFDLRSAVTGLTVTLAAADKALAIAPVPPFILAGTAADIVLANYDVQHIVPPSAPEDEWPVIAPGNGVALWQMDNGTTADIRRFFFEMVWDEIG